MSMYTYTFLDIDFKREQVTEFLDSKPSIEHWFYCLPNMIFIRTNLSAHSLSSELTKKFGNHRHFISEVSSSNRWGYLPKEQWDFF